MNVVTIVGLAAGALLILAAVAVFLMKKEISSGGVGVAAVALVLIGMSQWTSIKINAGGTSLELLRQTAEAAAQVAAQAEQTATVVETTKQQVATLTQQLETKNVLSPAALQAIHSNLQSSPRVDVGALSRARATFSRISKP